MAVDSGLVRSWLAARSLARGLPEPVADHGGFRVDTGSEKELRRWVFGSPVAGIAQIAAGVSGPRQPIKLCGSPIELQAAVPSGWAVTGGSAFMAFDGEAGAAQLPAGYSASSSGNGGVTKVEIRDSAGALAASGYAAEAADAFVFDRIETEPLHRRRGLGRSVMALLSAARKSPSAIGLLVATEEGQRLYSALGWRTVSPYSTAFIPEVFPPVSHAL